MKSTKSLPFLLTKVPSLTLHFILGLVGVGLGERIGGCLAGGRVRSSGKIGSFPPPFYTQTLELVINEYTTCSLRHERGFHNFITQRWPSCFLNLMTTDTQRIIY